jgi:hypothetical protein
MLFGKEIVRKLRGRAAGCGGGKAELDRQA